MLMKKSVCRSFDYGEPLTSAYTEAALTSRTNFVTDWPNLIWSGPNRIHNRDNYTSEQECLGLICSGQEMST